MNFLCQIYGVPVPVVTWYKILDEDDLELLPDHTQLYVLALTQTAPFDSVRRLTIPNVDDRAAGKYRCVGENRLGRIHSDFQLLIRGRQRRTASPEAQPRSLQARSTGVDFLGVKP